MYLINSTNFIHTYQNSVSAPAISRRRCLVLIIFLICIFTLTAPLYASQVCKQFSGKVLDMRTIEPLSGVSVSIRCFDADKMEVKTDDNGKFSISEVPYGAYKVTISKEGYASDVTKINITQPYVRYDSTIESERDKDNRTRSDFEEEHPEEAKKRKITITDAPEFLPKNNLYGASGLLELPDTSVMTENHYRVGYGVLRSRRMKSIGGAYRESNFATSFSYGLSQNFEANVFAMQNFAELSGNSPFFMNKTGISVKYSNLANYKATQQKFPYSVLYTHTNDGTDEINIPVEIASGDNKFYFIPSYESHGGKVKFHLGYQKPLFVDHRKGSFMFEFLQDDKNRWNIMNGGFRFEFKNDSAINLFVLTDQTVAKRMSTGISGTMLFR